MILAHLKSKRKKKLIDCPYCGSKFYIQICNGSKYFFQNQIVLINKKRNQEKVFANYNQKIKKIKRRDRKKIIFMLVKIFLRRQEKFIMVKKRINQFMEKRLKKESNDLIEEGIPLIRIAL